MRLLGVTDAQIDAIAKSGAPSEHVTFSSPASGYVIEKDVVEGGVVEPGARLFASRRCSTSGSRPTSTRRTSRTSTSASTPT